MLLDQEQCSWLYRLISEKTISSASLVRCNGFYLDQQAPTPKDEEVRDIIQKIWKVAQNYRLQQEGTLDFSLIWYILDEYGSGLVHNEQPNLEVFPLLFNP